LVALEPFSDLEKEYTKRVVFYQAQGALKNVSASEPGEIPLDPRYNFTGKAGSNLYDVQRET
jgi:hypothetical protein